MGAPNTSQINVADSPVSLASGPRGCITFINMGNNTVFLGGSGVSFQTGLPLPAPFGSMTIESCDDWYGVCSPGSSSKVAVLINTKAGLFFLATSTAPPLTSFRLPHFVHTFTNETSSARIVIGQNAVPATIGTAAFVGPDSGNLASTSFSSLATASTAVVAGMQQIGTTPVGDGWCFGTVDRMFFRVKLGSPAQSRYWIGMSNDSGSVFAATWATDNPNAHFAAFRAKSAEGTIKAICGTAAGSFTLVDTGVPFDLNWHNYEIVITLNGTLFTFIIDGKIVAQISSNIPSPSDIVKWFAIGDNLNTPTAIVITVQITTELFLI